MLNGKLEGGAVLEQAAASAKEPAPSDLTIHELVLAFYKHAERHYRRADGSFTQELQDYRYSLRPLVELYGSLPACEFSPLKLKAVRENMIRGGGLTPTGQPRKPVSRKLVNQRVGRVCRVFKWGVSEELVPVTTYQGLKAVAGLQAGRCDARERPAVEPVALEVVNATLPFLTPPVAAMVRLQLLTGARPGEVSKMRPVDIDRSGPVWVFRPSSHKTLHHGKTRAIAIGPRAQEVLLPFLAGRDPEAYLFSPREAMAAFRATQREQAAARRAAKGKKVPPSQLTWSKRKAKRRPKRKPGHAYAVRNYAGAIAVACDKAGVAHWHPHQLRHTRATEVRKAYGLEAAQVALGHSQARVTEVYAERDLTLATKVAAEIG